MLHRALLLLLPCLVLQTDAIFHFISKQLTRIIPTVKIDGNPMVNEDFFSARILSLFPSNFNIETQNIEFQNRKSECEMKRGVYVGRECLKFIKKHLNFQPARDLCGQIEGGDLWVPDLNDPHMFSNLARYYPAVLTASSRNFWVGIQRLGGRFFTVYGDDVTNTYFGILGDPGSAEGCVMLQFPIDEYPRLRYAGCSGTTKSDFVCEYPLILEDTVETEKKLTFNWNSKQFEVDV